MQSNETKEELGESSQVNPQENVPEETITKQKKKGFHINIHVVMLTLIVVIFAIAAIKLIQWNKGVTIDIDPTADTSEFDVEALDSIMPLPPNMSEGHEYDDELTILCLGNGPFSDSTEEGSLSGMIGGLLNANVYNGAFPNSTLASKNLNFIEQNYPDDVFTLPYVCEAISTGNFSQLESIQESYRSDGGTTIAALDTLKNQVDYSKVDCICIFYDATDYMWMRSLDNPLDDKERCSYTGALRYSLSLLQQTMPYARIIVMSPYYCRGTYEDGSTYDPGVVNFGNGDLTSYLLKEIDTASSMSVSIVDNFYGSINQDNYLQYTEEDGKTLNNAGRTLLAHRFADAYNKYK